MRRAAVSSMARHSGSLAKAYCADATSNNVVRVSFTEIPFNACRVGCVDRGSRLEAGLISRPYFFLSVPKAGFHPAAFWLGAAAMVFIFSFLGFFASRLPRCSPLAISTSPGISEVRSLRFRMGEPIGRPTATSHQRIERKTDWRHERSLFETVRPFPGNSYRFLGPRRRDYVARGDPSPR